MSVSVNDSAPQPYDHYYKAAMTSNTSTPFESILQEHRPDLTPYEKLYKHFHSHPELSSLESETAKHVTGTLRSLADDLDIKEGIGGHGVVAILRNGKGKTVLLRADMDALPIKESTGLEYASTATMKDVDDEVKPVMHGKGLSEPCSASSS